MENIKIFGFDTFDFTSFVLLMQTANQELTNNVDIYLVLQFSEHLIMLLINY